MKKEMFKKINLKDWEKVGEGGNAESFFHKKDKKKVLKLAKTGERQINKIFEEAEVAQNAIDLGIKTPKILGYAKCDDRYGIIYERLEGKKSFGKLCHDDPENTDEYAKIFARELYKLHKIKCNKKKIRSKKTQITEKINAIKDEKYKKICLSFVKDLKDVNTVIHGDASMGNLLQVGKKYYWIDLGTMMYGDPAYDLGILYISYTFFVKLKYVQNIFHVTEKQAYVFYLSFIKEYAKVSKQKEKELHLRAKKVGVIILLIMAYVEKFAFFGKLIFKAKAKSLIKEIEKT